MKKAFLFIGGVVAAFGVAVYFFPNVIPGNSITSMFASVGGATPGATSAAETIVDVPTEPVPPLEKAYTNQKYRFGVKIPTNFTVRELPPDESNGSSIVFENPQGGGVQIYITPDPDKNTTLTADQVRASIPDMRVVDEQDVDIGTDGSKGVAFKSNNDAFERNSREVWFYFHGNLYQISTYARFDPLLKAMFGTWQFF